MKQAFDHSIVCRSERFIQWSKEAVPSEFNNRVTTNSEAVAIAGCVPSETPARAIFEPADFRDRATYEHPHQYPTGAPPRKPDRHLLRPNE